MIQNVADRPVEDQVDGVVLRLAKEFGPSVANDQLRAVVSRGFQKYEQATIKTFVPILVWREARSVFRRSGGEDRAGAQTDPPVGLWARGARASGRRL